MIWQIKDISEPYEVRLSSYPFLNHYTHYLSHANITSLYWITAKNESLSHIYIVVYFDPGF